uniref:RUN and TBC1 domain-containing protein 3 n=1 Tax=Bursaphelenchus xylophilus TaxID=6326 RepID=A0A1I7STV8_BURXY
MRSGYKTGDDAKNVVVHGESEDESESADVKLESELTVGKAYIKTNGAPLSGIHPKIKPKYFQEPCEDYDELGFKKEGPDSLFGPLEVESNRLQWIAHIQFKNGDVNKDITWDDVDGDLFKDQKSIELVKKSGIPHSFRSFMWPRFCGATSRRISSPYKFDDIFREADEEVLNAATQIERDLLRTLPNHYCFSKMDSFGTKSLRRVLKALAYFYPELGYCQGMGTVVATLLLLCDEENVFWIMCKMIENFLPVNFYGDNLIGLQAEVKVVEHLIEVHMPEVSNVLKNADSEVSLIIANWLLTLGSSVLPMPLLFRIWDILFQQGIVVFYRMLISMFKMNEERIISELTDRPVAVFGFIQALPSSLHDVDDLIEHMSSFEFSITDQTITTLRKAHQGNIMSENGLIYQSDAPLPYQTTNSRKLTKSKSIIENIFKSAEVPNDPKTKNVRVTELIVALRSSIYQVCDHFRTCPESHQITIQATYAVDECVRDREEFKNARRKGQKHARALLDFDTEEKDELSFKKNDIITVLSERDEHCWVGELNGERGWFPAKFVQIVDERSKKYCAFGDEMLTPKIGNLVRNSLFNSLYAILSYGLRPTGIVTSKTHPWHYIEALADALMEAHNNITHSKLTLCDTFNLDQDGKVRSTFFLRDALVPRFM